jgi:hypothetical protein
VRTAAELFASLEPGQTVDLDGESIASCEVDAVPAGVTIAAGFFIGELLIHGAQQLTFTLSSFTADTDVELQSTLKFLGGRGWQVLGCSFEGGWVKSHLGVGYDSSQRGQDGLPIDWLVSGCTFDPIAKQWGSYPQGHSVYVLTSPRWPMGGRIEHCRMEVGTVGASLKIGGTGNAWRTEGVQGVVVEQCEIVGTQDDAGRCLAVLTQGARTRDVVLRDCTLRGEGGVPWVQAMDGAHVELEGTKLPDGVRHYARRYLGPFGWITREDSSAVVGRRRAGITWR